METLINIATIMGFALLAMIAFAVIMEIIVFIVGFKFFKKFNKK